MNVRYQRQGAFLTNFREAPGSLHIGHRQPGNLTAGGCQLTKLL